MGKINFKKLLISFLLPFAAGFIGSFFTVSAISVWYENLLKPSLNPPSWVFAPVWTILYFLMGLSLYLAWSKVGTEIRLTRRPIFVFLIQIFLNTSWSLFFFGLQNPLLALINIALLWLSIIWMISVFSKFSKTASWLIIPYFFWVSFAFYLNFAIWFLN